MSSEPPAPDDPRALGEERGEEDGCLAFLQRYGVRQLQIGLAVGTFDDCQYNRLRGVVPRALIRRTQAFTRPLPR